MLFGSVEERLQRLLADADASTARRLPPERELAATLGVSRTTLREWLRRLADLGVLEARQGSGTYIHPVHLDDLLDARLALEPHAAGRAAGRRDEQDLSRLEIALADMEASLDRPTIFAAADLRAHTAIIDAAHSMPLRTMHGSVVDLLRYSRSTTVDNPGLRGASLEQMRQIVQAIEQGRGDNAKAGMTAHLMDVAEALGRREAGPAAWPPIGVV
jgi:GntR family transcriptional repressor for pyruvate dehydrogenase complex